MVEPQSPDSHQTSVKHSQITFIDKLGHANSESQLNRHARHDRSSELKDNIINYIMAKERQGPSPQAPCPITLLRIPFFCRKVPLTIEAKILGIAMNRVWH